MCSFVCRFWGAKEFSNFCIVFKWAENIIGGWYLRELSGCKACYTLSYIQSRSAFYTELYVNHSIRFNQINLQTICLPYFSFISRFCYLKGYNFLPILSYLHLHIHILPTVMYKKNTFLEKDGLFGVFSPQNSEMHSYCLWGYLWGLCMGIIVCSSNSEDTFCSILPSRGP